MSQASSQIFARRKCPNWFLFRMGAFDMGKANYVIVAVLSIGFLLSATGEVLVVKEMNYGFGVSLPVFNTIIMNLYLPIQVAIYIWVRRREKMKGTDRPITRPYFYRQSVLAIISVALNLFRYFALDTIPASVYVMVGTSDIFFNILLSKFVLRKSFTIYHYASALLAMTAIVIIGVGAQGGTSCGTSSCLTVWAPGILFTLLGAFLAAVTSVGSEYLFKKDGKGGEDSNFQMVCEIGIFYAAYGLLLSPIPLVASNEQVHWDSRVGHVSRSGLFALLCFALLFCKLGFRNFKFAVISYNSAFYFAILNSLKTLLTILFAVFILGEPFTTELGIGFPIVTLALGFYLYGGYLNSQKKKKDALNPAELPKSDACIVDACIVEGKS